MNKLQKAEASMVQKMRINVGMLLCFVGSFAQAEGTQALAITTQEVATVKNPKALRTITRDVVDAHKKTIRAYIKKNNRDRVIVRTATIAGLAGLLGYIYYYTQIKGVNPATVTSVPKAEIHDVNVGVQGLRVQVAGLQDALKKLPGFALPEVVVKTDVVPEAPKTVLAQTGMVAKEIGLWVYGIGKYFATAIVAAAPSAFISTLIIRETPTIPEVWNKAISEPIGKVCHPGDSKWFLRKQVHYEELFKHLELRAQELPLSPEGFERNHFVSQFITDVNVFMYQLARVIAFLEIQSAQIGKTNPVCGAHLNEKAVFVYNLAEDFSLQMAIKLADKQKHAEIPAALSGLRRKLKEEFDSFHLYERAALYDIVPS